MPTDVVAILLGMRHARSAAQLLARLGDAGLVQHQMVRPGPLVGSRPVRLWTLAPAGSAILTTRGLTVALEDRCQLPYGEPERRRETARQHDIPMLIATYRLLADVASGLEQPVRVCTFEHPWIRTFTPAEGRTCGMRDCRPRRY
jgi:hypothetical protein